MDGVALSLHSGAARCVDATPVCRTCPRRQDDAAPQVIALVTAWPCNTCVHIAGTSGGEVVFGQGSLPQLCKRPLQAEGQVCFQKRPCMRPPCAGASGGEIDFGEEDAALRIRPHHRQAPLLAVSLSFTAAELLSSWHASATTRRDARRAAEACLNSVQAESCKPRPQRWFGASSLPVIVQGS